MRYKQIYDGDRVRPVMRGYLMKCCGCGLVHSLDFFVVKHGRGHKVEFTATSLRAKRSARRKARK